MKFDGSYRTRKPVQEMQAHQHVEQEPVTLQAKSGYRVTIPAVVVASLISAFGARQIPTASPEVRTAERIENKLDQHMLRYERDRAEDANSARAQNDRDNKQETAVSLIQAQMMSCCAKER